MRIDRAALLHNLEVFQKEYAPVRVAPVLKSNAYGHGLVQVARILEATRPPFLVVESYYEAIILRNEGIRSPILVMGYTATENIQRCGLRDVAFTLVSHEQLLELASALRRPQRFHLKVDTGMRRYGVEPFDVPDALATIKASGYIRLEGVCSHMAQTIAPSDRVARAQIKAWNTITRVVKNEFPNIPHRHLASTGGSYWSADIDANIIRVGLGCYGIDYSPRRTLPVQPVLSVTSTLGAIRQVSPGEGVGYGHTFVADRAMTVATVASGYDACMDVRLSNKGTVLLQGHPCPIVGRICMNGAMIDVTAVPNVKPGDEVLLISQVPEDPNSVQNMAQLTGASPHVILTSISSALQRVIT